MLRIHLGENDWLEEVIEYIVEPDIPEILLGTNILLKYKSVIDYAKNALYLTINNHIYKIRLQKTLVCDMT